VILGCGFGFIVTLTNIRGRAGIFFFWGVASLLPMMIPPQVTASEAVALFGPASLFKHLGHCASV